MSKTRRAQKLIGTFITTEFHNEPFYVEGVGVGEHHKYTFNGKEKGLILKGRIFSSAGMAIKSSESVNSRVRYRVIDPERARELWIGKIESWIERYSSGFITDEDKKEIQLLSEVKNNLEQGKDLLSFPVYTLDVETLEYILVKE